MNAITINWHIIQKCNYSCHYCFAKYEKNNKNDICESKEDIEKILEDVYDYFSQKYAYIRLNIAGGEPTLVKNLSFIIKTANMICFKVSLITNATRITTKFIEINAKYISMFAVSIDSINNDENISIGRTSKTDKLSISKIIKFIEEFKQFNPNIRIKINTVVNK